MSISSKITHFTIKQWIKEHLPETEVKGKLISLGLDETAIAENLKEFNKLKNARRQNFGFVLIAIGAFLGFISCVLTMMEIFPELNNFFLYGLTSIAIVVVLVGFYYVFE
jgi:uncharacterized membrane protein YjfL (UPF0719 family)